MKCKPWIIEQLWLWQISLNRTLSRPLRLSFQASCIRQARTNIYQIRQTCFYIMPKSYMQLSLQFSLVLGNIMSLIWQNSLFHMATSREIQLHLCSVLAPPPPRKAEIMQGKAMMNLFPNWCSTLKKYNRSSLDERLHTYHWEQKWKDSTC